MTTDELIEKHQHRCYDTTAMRPDVTLNRDLFDTAVEDRSRYKSKPGLTREIVVEISRQKNEPAWMLNKRLAAFELFQKTPLPSWGPDLSKLNLDEIIYFVRPDTQESRSWEDVPSEIRTTFDRLGIPKAEQEFLAGVGAQFDSDIVYHNIKKEWESKGVIFENMDVAVQKHPELVKEHFMTSCIPINDHKFIMLHAAVWSGGTFIYVPPNVTVDIPLQAYFRMNASGGGQFEHTLIIADVESTVHYIEGCSSPRFETGALHAGGVEIFVRAGAHVTYTSIENWSKNTYNLNTKRALVDKNGTIEWLNGNMGCLPGSSRIQTVRGPIPIQNIKPGEVVYAWDEKTNNLKTATVTKWKYSGRKKIYQIKAGGRVVQASGNHPFLTLTRRKNKNWHKKGFFRFEWKPLEQLTTKDVIGLVKKLPAENRSPYLLPKIQKGKAVNSNNQYARFKMHTKHLYNPAITTPKETNEDFLWLAGILLGDGHIDTKNNKINIATHQTEDYRDHLCKILKTLFGYAVTEKKERYIIINSKILCALFTELGFGGIAETKRLPFWVFSLPTKQQLALLAGYFDSDGHPATTGLAFTSINKMLLEDIKLLGIALGFNVTQIFKHRNAGKTRVVGNMCNTHDSWRILLSGKELKNFPSRCARKKHKIDNIKTRRDFGSSQGLNFHSKTNDEIGFSKISKILEIGTEPTYDIEVEQYHNFIAEGLIAHNSQTTMLYPCSILRGEGARSDSLGVVFAGPGQNQDTGSKVIHVAPNTHSTIRSKSISRGGGVASYRGLVKVIKRATESRCSVVCDALILDGASTSNTYPTMKIETDRVDVVHEATVGKIGEEELFYLTSRGLTEDQALKMIVAGFIAPAIKQMPLEYAVELNKLIELEMEGSVG